MASEFDQKMNDFITYKLQVPVCGAIILNPSMKSCLLVKGYKQNAKWGFPRGKIGKDEEKHNCAVREVYEEIGFDIKDLINPEHYIEKNYQSVPYRLYIIENVDDGTAFEPKTRKEISRIEWFNISQLNSMDDKYLWLVRPFLTDLMKWIKQRRKALSILELVKPKKQKSLKVNAKHESVNFRSESTDFKCKPVTFLSESAIFGPKLTDFRLPEKPIMQFRFDREVQTLHPMEQKPVVKASQYATKAEESYKKGNTAEAIKFHNQAAELFLAAIQDTSNPQLRKTLKLSSNFHLQKANELARIEAEPKLKPETENEKIEAPITTVSGEIVALKEEDEEEIDPFEKFWDVVEGLVQKLPVAFTTAPLTESKRNAALDESYFIVDKPSGPQPENTFDFSDIETSFFKPQQKKTMKELEQENYGLKQTIEILSKKLSKFEKAAEENMMLKSSILQFKHEFQKTGFAFKGHDSMLSSKYFKQQNDTNLVKKLQTDLQSLQLENKKQKEIIEKYRNRWNSLKESARRKKTEISLRGEDSITFEFDDE